MDASERIRAALATLDDPEIGRDLVSLGLVERIEVSEGKVLVRLVPTSVTCPMADLLVEQASAAVRAACPAGTEIDVDIDWGQTWSPARMSESLRHEFGW